MAFLPSLTAAHCQRGYSCRNLCLVFLPLASIFDQVLTTPSNCSHYFFQKIGWEKSKLVASIKVRLTPVQLKYASQYRTHRFKLSGGECFAVDNDGSAVLSFTLLVKSLTKPCFQLNSRLSTCLQHISNLTHFRPPTGSRGFKALIPMVQLATHRTG